MAKQLCHHRVCNLGMVNFCSGRAKDQAAVLAADSCPRRVHPPNITDPKADPKAGRPGDRINPGASEFRVSSWG